MVATKFCSILTCRKNCKSSRKPFDFREFRGGDCWTRTSDLLRVKDSAQNARQPFCQAACGDFTFAFFPQISQKAIQNCLFFGTKNGPSNQSALRISYHYFWLLYNPLRAEFWTDQAITFHATCNISDRLPTIQPVFRLNCCGLCNSCAARKHTFVKFESDAAVSERFIHHGFSSPARPPCRT